jgi:predicted phosphodiesterase
MRQLGKIFLIITIACYLVSCKADPKGLVSSTDVDKRFEDSASLPEKKDVIIGEEETEFSFIVIADPHVYHGSDSGIKALKTKLIQDRTNGENDKFLIACGDISQRGDTEDLLAFRDTLEPEFPVYTTIGNHDLYFDGWYNYREILGKSCYTFTAGPSVRFVSFDSANGTLGRKQKNWLEGVLKNSTEPFCFVYTHFELFSPNSTTIQQYTDIEEAYFLIHLFKKTGVDYVLMGHSHDYYDKEINGTHYVNISDFTDKQDYFRFHVNLANKTIKYERKSL